MEALTLTPATVSEQTERFIAAIPAYPGGYSGRGIVICGGGAKYFPGAWVGVRMLRQLGCTLPVEIWHLGEKELSEQMRALVAPYDVRCVDALKVRETHPCRRLNGWELKAYAVLHSRFREVLLLDADNVPVVDPTYLFETPQYRQRGAVFWPDIERFSDSAPSYCPRIWRMLGLEAPWDQPEFETGQLLVDKEACWRPLCLAMWFNECSDFFYNYVYGDKETFHLAWRKLGVPFAMPTRPIHWLPATMCQHDFGGQRVFQHRNQAKWRLGRNRALPGFWFESNCLIYLWELAAQWDGRVGDVPRFVPNAHTPADIAAAARGLIAGTYFYARGRQGQHRIVFQADGTIAPGRGVPEAFWDVRSEDGDLCLHLSSEAEVACRLFKGEDGAWREKGREHDPASVDISPLAVPRLVINGDTPEAVKAEAQALLAGAHVYERVGHDQRRMTFDADGKVRQGSAELETFWDVRAEEGVLCLYLSSASEVTCRLLKSPDGVWRGRWLAHERMPIKIYAA